MSKRKKKSEQEEVLKPAQETAETASAETLAEEQQNQPEENNDVNADSEQAPESENQEQPEKSEKQISEADKKIIEGIIEQLPVPLEDEKMVELARHMAELIIKADEMEAELKAHASNIREQVKEKLAEAAGIAKRLNDGHVIKDVECYIVENDPEPGIKTLYRMDTSDKVRSMRMSTLFPEMIDKSENVTFPENKEALAAEAANAPEVDMDSEEFKARVKDLHERGLELPCHKCDESYIARVEDIKKYASGRWTAEDFICDRCHRVEVKDQERAEDVASAEGTDTENKDAA